MINTIIDPTAGAVILMAASAGFGYAVARYPELPGILKGSVSKIKAKLEEAKADGIPEGVQDLYDSAYAEVIAWDAALEDDRISWLELRDIGIKAYRLGKVALAKIGK